MTDHLRHSGGPVPAHILAGQERVRAAGLCGELIEDGKQMCIREAGHEPPHGDADTFDPRMIAVRWTLTGRDQFRAEVFDGPMLASGERVPVAPAAALEEALEAVKLLSDALGVAMVAVQDFVDGDGPRGTALLPLLSLADKAADKRDALLSKEAVDA